MVGLLPIGKGSPARGKADPPPYREHEDEGVIISQVSTTTTTTFLSWFGRRGAATLPSTTNSSLSRQSTCGVDENGVRAHTDKDLPPTPPHETDAEHREPIRSRTSAYSLVHAALSAGLPPIIPNASEANTVEFAAATPHAESSSSGSRLSAAALRRSKSSQKLVADMSSTERVAHRRVRGVSMGSTALFGAESAKGKGKDSHPTTPTKGVARRPSFWSRKSRVEQWPSTADSLELPKEELVPALPSVVPASPFRVDLQHSPSSSQIKHRRGLSRSHSERARPHSSGHSLDVTPPTPTSPIVIVPRASQESTQSRPRSFFFDPSSAFTSSPMHSPALLPPGDHYGSPPPSALHARSPSRPRAQTNPPLLHRLSVNFFATPAAPPISGSANFFGNMRSSTASPGVGISGSPRPSLNKSPVKIPKPHTDEESPEVYLQRLLAAVSKAEIAGVLASSGDPFYARALKTYIEVFNFVDDPLDVALRKLLMDVGLPRETQQIDRVMEAFASRYMQCNPSLFTSDDHPYILAFSLIMLHTDAFNKSNKRKMTKADYVKNTRLPGVPPEVLDCFYDNIVFAPFIFVEDPVDVNGQRGLITADTSPRVSAIAASPMNGSGSTLLGKAVKLDPYFLIVNNQVGPLRVETESYVPSVDPYSYEGTAGPWDEEELQRAFAKATPIEFGTSDINRSSAFFGIGTSPAPDPIHIPTMSHTTASSFSSSVCTLKVTKVGLLNRKDDILEGGRRGSSRKWKAWSVLLAGSQLLLFRDPSWATNLLQQAEKMDGQVVLPQTTVFRPDEFLSVKDAVAVYDRSYAKYWNAFRLVMPDGRQFLLQASDENELNEWISRINYASAFKTAGVRMRALGMSGKDVELTGVAAATSHLHDMEHQRLASPPRVRKLDVDRTTPRTSGSMSFERPSIGRRVLIREPQGSMDADVPSAPEVDGAAQFKATFDGVKAELAAGHWMPEDDVQDLTDEPAPISPTLPTGVSERSRLPSRSAIIKSKIKELESKISAARSQLDADLRFVRNIATLTPFQRTTRDRLQLAVQNMSKRVSQGRLEMVKLVCHRDVLVNDLVAEVRDLERAKKGALRAATIALQTKQAAKIPKMILSFHNNDREASLPRTMDSSSSPRPIPKSSHHHAASVADSFHSALDFAPEWAASEDTSLLAPSLVFDSPASSTSLASLPFSDDARVPSSAKGSVSSERPSISSRQSGSVNHEKFYTAQEAHEEQAEDWHKTRAAHRVSLVRMPSDTRITTLFGRSSFAVRRAALGDGSLMNEEAGS